jgi:hypothetical protein
MNYWIVNKDPESPIYKLMIACFDEAGKENCSIGPDQEWLLCPEGVAPGNAKVQEVEGVLSLVDGSADKEGPKWDALRLERDKRLSVCDWTQGNDSPLVTQSKTDWATYRQSLRDLPSNTTDPDSVVWPTKP